MTCVCVALVDVHCVKRPKKRAWVWVVKTSLSRFKAHELQLCAMAEVVTNTAFRNGTHHPAPHVSRFYFNRTVYRGILFTRIVRSRRLSGYIAGVVTLVWSVIVCGSCLLLFFCSSILPQIARCNWRLKLKESFPNCILNRIEVERCSLENDEAHE